MTSLHKCDQVVKELQFHFSNGNLTNEMIQEKCDDIWRSAKGESDQRHFENFQELEKGLKDLPKKVVSEMFNSHFWVGDDGDEECGKCGKDYQNMYRIPTYCLSEWK